MTYLDEAYRRFKLPIRVSWRIDPNGYWMVHKQQEWIGYALTASTPESAKTLYLAAVKELSHD